MLHKYLTERLEAEEALVGGEADAFGDLRPRTVQVKRRWATDEKRPEIVRLENLRTSSNMDGVAAVERLVTKKRVTFTTSGFSPKLLCTAFTTNLALVCTGSEVRRPARGAPRDTRGEDEARRVAPQAGVIVKADIAKLCLVTCRV
jgi:hypothetical protein